VQQAIFDAAGVAILEGCPDTVIVPARLIQLDPTGRHPTWRASTGLCPNGATAHIASRKSQVLTQ
jgi:hypothetical protein